MGDSKLLWQPDGMQGTNMQRTSKPSRDRVAIFQATSFHRNNRSQLPSVMDRLELQRCAFLQT